jgi:hypothetical protein
MLVKIHERAHRVICSIGDLKKTYPKGRGIWFCTRIESCFLRHSIRHFHNLYKDQSALGCHSIFA